MLFKDPSQQILPLDKDLLLFSEHKHENTFLKESTSPMEEECQNGSKNRESLFLYLSRTVIREWGPRAHISPQTAQNTEQLQRIPANQSYE